MEQYYHQFVTNLSNFISDLNRYIPNAGCDRFISVFDKIDMGKVMLRYLSTMRDYETLIKTRDELLFTNKLVILPDIDISEFWPKLSSGQKRKVWTYLQLLYVQSELILNYKESAQGDTEKNKTLKTMLSDVKDKDNDNDKNTSTEEFTFNPYVGIGGSQTEYSIDEMYAGHDYPDEEQATPGLGSLASMVGLDKMLNVDKLSEQLKNMRKEDIDEATSNIKGLLANNVDEKTSGFIGEMLTSITDELSKDDISKGNPIDSIMRIAETVADKIKPKMESQDIDMTKLWNSTQELANNCKDDDGNTPFGSNRNPFGMLNSLVSQLNNADPSEVDQEAYMNSCNDALRSMGMGNGINMQALQRMQQHMQGQQGTGTYDEIVLNNRNARRAAERKAQKSAAKKR